MVEHFEINADHAGQRLDNYLQLKLKGVPKSKLYNIIRKGEVRVNSKRVRPEYKLVDADKIRIPPLRRPDPKKPLTPSHSLQQMLSACIVYEDKALLVINKPSGMAVHGGSSIKLGVIEALRALRTEQHQLELVHRLDRDTSGCLMISKSRTALKSLHLSLREGKVEKTYLALVAGSWPRHCQTVSAPLQKNTLRSGERVVKVDSVGKASSTLFKVITRFPNATLLQVKPLTGRTHQIRVHALYVGCPILGDTKYGVEQANKNLRKLGLKRLFLHAERLVFPDPQNAKKLDVRVELADELKSVLEKLSAKN